MLVTSRSPLVTNIFFFYENIQFFLLLRSLRINVRITLFIKYFRIYSLNNIIQLKKDYACSVEKDFFNIFKWMGTVNFKWMINKCRHEHHHNTDPCLKSLFQKRSLEKCKNNGMYWFHFQPKASMISSWLLMSHVLTANYNESTPRISWNLVRNAIINETSENRWEILANKYLISINTSN